MANRLQLGIRADQSGVQGQLCGTDMPRNSHRPNTNHITTQTGPTPIRLTSPYVRMPLVPRFIASVTFAASLLSDDGTTPCESVVGVKIL
eukprot:749343-Hanusia_phi.AAC.6